MSTGCEQSEAEKHRDDADTFEEHKNLPNKEIAGFAVSIGTTSVLLPMQKTLELQY
jgi:hypothetical protein